MLLRIIVFMLTLLPAVVCFAHSYHGHDANHSPISENQWRAALQRFSRIGDPADLAQARAALEQRRSSAAEPTVATLYLSAWTSQADHQFDDAQGYLASLLQTKPRWAAGHLMQASLALVKGDYQRARAACRSLLGIPLEVRLACRAQSERAPSPQQYQTLAAAVGAGIAHGESGKEQHDLLSWLQRVLGDMAVRAGLAEQAVGHYRLAQRYAPSVRGQVALAQTLLDLNRPEAALALLPADSPALSVQVKRLVVGQRMRHPTVMVRRQSSLLESRFEQWLALGDLTHGREMAEFYLRVQGQPQRALDILQTSLALQREYEDERLLAEAQQALLARWHQPEYAQGAWLLRKLAYTGG